ncbi:cystine/glutamate transporter-like [Glandiceps talaboti]
MSQARPRKNLADDANCQVEIVGNSNRDKIKKEEEEKEEEEEEEEEEEIVEDKVVLKRQLNLFFCITMIVGTTIGSGIFISPKNVLRYTESVGLSLIVWASCGIVVILGGLSYAELGTTFGKSGGDYSYIGEAFGELPAFLVVWTYLTTVLPAGIAILSISFATYVTEPFYVGCETPKSAATLVAVATLIFIVFLNGWKVKASASVQNIFTVAKVTGLLIIVVAGIVQLFQGTTEHLENAFDGKVSSILNISLAFYSALFAYGGWDNLNMMTEELKNPTRNFPISVVVSELLITFLYVTANIAYLTAMSAEELLRSNAVAVTFAENVFPSFSWAITVFVALSIFGALNGTIMAKVRMVFVCARDGQLPDILSMIHVHYRTPLPSLLILGALSMLILIVSSIAGDGIYQLLNFAAFPRWLIIAGSTASLLYLRWKRPNIPRPFKVPIVIPLTFFLCLVYLEVTGLIAAPVEAGIGLALMFSGVPVYFFGKWKNKPRFFRNCSDAVGKFLQTYLLVVQQEGETY